MDAPFATNGTRAAAAKENPNFVPISFVHGAAFRSLIESGWWIRPAYRLNHEEVIKALEEGITFIENMNPEEAVVDEDNAVTALRFRGERIASWNLPAQFR